MFSFRKNKSVDTPRRRLQAAGDERRERAAEIASDQNFTFRRNRTLTGSLSSQVSGAAELKGDLQSSRTHAHHLAIQRRKLLAVFGVVIVISGALTALLYSFTAYPRISTNTTALDEPQRYEKVVNEYLSRHPIERLRPALDEQRLAEWLQEKVPEVASVTQEGFYQLGITDFKLTMRQPLAVWIIGGKQYFVDDQGISFEKNYYETPAVSVVDQSGVQQSTGTTIASSRFLTFVGQVVAQAKQHGLVVQQAIIPAGTTRQLEVKLEGRGYPIKLSLDRPASEQVEDMKNAVGYFDAHQLSPQYIDVRVSGKAFYR